MIQDLEAKIINLVAEKSGMPPSAISLHSRLLQDLGIDGDDAAEFLQLVSKQFQIVMTDFDFMRYFRSEPNLFSIFQGSSARRREAKEKIPVTVFDIVEAAKAQRWIFPARQ